MTALAITRQDILPLSIYRPRRERYLQKMIAYKKARRVQLMENMSLLFENRNTVLFQIQELVNCEDLADVAELDEYIEIYSGMLPRDRELSATLFIEIDDQQRLEEFLVKLMGIERHLKLVVGEEIIQAVFESDHSDREFTTSVHYLKFPLTKGAYEYLLQGTMGPGSIRVILDHPEVFAEVALCAETIDNLRNDLKQ